MGFSTHGCSNQSPPATAKTPENLPLKDETAHRFAAQPMCLSAPIDPENLRGRAGALHTFLDGSSNSSGPKKTLAPVGARVEEEKRQPESYQFNLTDNWMIRGSLSCWLRSCNPVVKFGRMSTG